MNEIEITNTNGVLTVSSLQVAKDFNKQHKHILEKIDDIMAQINSAENSAQYFIESSYTDKSGKSNKCYDITRDGFSLLVMGFTGKKALEWKLKYIEAFNSMERQLTDINLNIEEVVNRMLDEKIEDIVNKAVSEAISETVKVLSPFLTLPARKYTTEVMTIEKPYKYSSSKIFRLSPEIKKQVDEMIISGNYSCQQIADFITERSGMKISYMTISRYIKKYFILQG